MHMGCLVLCNYDWEGNLVPDHTTFKPINSVTRRVDWFFEGRQNFAGIIAEYFPEDEYEPTFEETLLIYMNLDDRGGKISIYLPEFRGNFQTSVVLWGLWGSNSLRSKLDWKKDGF